MNTLIVGATLSGKSTAEAKKLTKLALQHDRAIVVCDPHRDSLALNLMQQLEGAGQVHRVTYDRLADTDRVLGWTFLAPSSNSDSAQKEAENDERIRAFADVLLRRRGLQGLADKPLIEEWTTAALRLWMHQEKSIPLTTLPFVFHPRHPVFRQAVEHCTDEETTWKFRELARLSATALRNEVAPAGRLLASVCSSPAFRLRSGGPSDRIRAGTFDLESFLNSKGILILEGGGEGLSDDAARTMFGAAILRVIQHVKRSPSCRVQLVLDEANNFHLVGPYEMRALAETQKMGLDIDVLVQALDFPSEEIRNGVLTNCGWHEWFRCGSADVARMGAEDLLALLDPYKLHHREERPRQLQDGYDAMPVTSTQTWNDARGEGTSVTKSTWPLSRYRDITDQVDHYERLRDQLLLLQKELMELPTGWRYRRIGGQVQKEYVTLPDDPWTLPKLSQKRTEQAIQQIKLRPCFRSPTITQNTYLTATATARSQDGDDGITRSSNG